MARPVFVLGKHRSGTSWLANQLCEHPRIAGVLHEDHLGIVESKMFSRLQGRYGDLQNPRNHAELVAVTTHLDYGEIAGVDPETLEGLYPTTFPEYVRAFHDQLAEAQEATHWLEKTPEHTLHLENLLEWYPGARFVGVVRNVEDVVASHLAWDPDKDPREISTLDREQVHRVVDILRASARWTLYRKVLEHHADRSTRVKLVRFEDMKEDLGDVLQGVCEFLDLPYHEGMTEDRWPRNTSYSGGRKREDELSGTERALVHITVASLDALPWRALLWMMGTDDQPEGSLPPWAFRVTTDLPEERPPDAA